MGWTPEQGFIESQWDRFNEATILYLLAIGSPTHPIDPAIWTRWTANFSYSWGDHWGERHLAFPPLFGHQFSHLWVDFRGIRDPWLRAHDLDLFENSRRATRAQRNYAIANPGRWAGYGPDCWGLTACDGPGDFKLTINGREREFLSYSARGPGAHDDGTLAPTAMASSIAFEPGLVLSGLAEMKASLWRGDLRPVRVHRRVQSDAGKGASGRHCHTGDWFPGPAGSMSTIWGSTRDRSSA